MPYARVPATGRVIQSALPMRPAERSSVRHVNKVPDTGWLRVREEPSGTSLFLFKYTRLTHVQERGERTHFKIAEGPYAGRSASLAQANAREYLGSRAPRAVPAQLTVTYGAYQPGWYSEARKEKLDQQLAQLEIAGVSASVTMNTIWGAAFTPLPPGDYNVLLPDVPHKAEMTRFYRHVEPALVFDQVWFPIERGDNSRYVHIGNVSEGCVTLLTLGQWPAIHEALLSHRSADGISVAKMTVTGKPKRDR